MKNSNNNNKGSQPMEKDVKSSVSNKKKSHQYQHVTGQGRQHLCHAQHSLYPHKLSLHGDNIHVVSDFHEKPQETRAPIPAYYDRCKIKCATASFRGNIGNVKSNLNNNFVQSVTINLKSICWPPATRG